METMVHLNVFLISSWSAFLSVVLQTSTIECLYIRDLFHQCSKKFTGWHGFASFHWGEITTTILFVSMNNEGIDRGYSLPTPTTLSPISHPYLQLPTYSVEFLPKYFFLHVNYYLLPLASLPTHYLLSPTPNLHTLSISRFSCSSHQFIVLN